MFAHAQEIRGVVTESGTNHGIEAVAVKLHKASPIPGSRIPGRQVAEAQTGARGDFRFAPEELGEYTLVFEKAGFSPVKPATSQTQPNQVNLILTREQPSREVSFVLGRPGEVVGRVVNADSNQPIPGFQFYLVAVTASRGALAPLGLKRVVTDAEGVFRAAGAGPGQYVIETGTEYPAPERFLKTFSKEDTAVVEPAYESSRGSVLEAASIRVISGATVDVGTLRVRQVPHYRVLVEVGQGGCDSGATLTVVLYNDGSGAPLNAAGDVECGKPVLFRLLPSGDYRVSARSKTGAKVQADVPVRIVNENVTVAISPVRGLDIQGRIIAAEQSRIDSLEKIRVAVSSFRGPSFGDQVSGTDAAAGGRFRLENHWSGTKRVFINGLPDGAFIKQIRYRGVRLNGNIFDAAGDGELEIEIDDRAALVTGSVRTNDRPVGRAHVALVRWPLEPRDLFGSVKQADADDDGKFQFGLLPAGEYRVLALPPDQRERIEEPGVLQRLLPRAERIVLERGGSQSVTLAPLDPDR